MRKWSKRRRQWQKKSGEWNSTALFHRFCSRNPSFLVRHLVVYELPHQVEEVLGAAMPNLGSDQQPGHHHENDPERHQLPEQLGEQGRNDRQQSTDSTEEQHSDRPHMERVRRAVDAKPELSPVSSASGLDLAGEKSLAQASSDRQLETSTAPLSDPIAAPDLGRIGDGLEGLILCRRDRVLEQASEVFE